MFFKKKSYPGYTLKVEGEKMWVHSNEISIELLEKRHFVDTIWKAYL